MLDGLDLERVDDIGAARFILNTGPWGWDENVERYEDDAASRARAATCRWSAPIPISSCIIVGRRAICAGAMAQRYEALGGRVRWHGKPYPGGL